MLIAAVTSAMVATLNCSASACHIAAKDCFATLLLHAIDTLVISINLSFLS